MEKQFKLSRACSVTVKDDFVTIVIARNGETFQSGKEGSKASWLVKLAGMPTVPGTDIHLGLMAWKPSPKEPKERKVSAFTEIN